MIEKKLTYKDVCDLTVRLLQDNRVKFDDEHLRSRIAVIGVGDFEAYMSDIGVTLSKDAFGAIATVRSVNDDQRWVRIKLKALLKGITEH